MVVRDEESQVWHSNSVLFATKDLQPEAVNLSIKESQDFQYKLESE